MPHCLFASDLHGKIDRYEKLLDAVSREKPDAVFLGGDLFPTGLLALSPWKGSSQAFLDECLLPEFRKLREKMGRRYPEWFLILGNDDARADETCILEAEKEGLWTYAHGRRNSLGAYRVYGYACVPPTPFALKDWERYDVSRHVDPGCYSPEEGRRTVPVQVETIRYGTITQDLEALTGDEDLKCGVLLAHCPPYQTMLDRAALDGKMVDHVPLDVNIGSIAIRRFIESRQPLLTLHGHVHESTRLTGSWRDKLGRTEMMNAAHDGEELALIRFDLDDPATATRELI